MRNEILYREDYIAIEYCPSEDWIYVNWRGYVTYDTVTAGCEQILRFMKEKGCNKILNDNTNVEGIWSTASKWVGENWFPRMKAEGLKHFAWIYSPSTFSRLSTDKALRHTSDTELIKMFDDIEDARNWLRSV